MKPTNVIDMQRTGDLGGDKIAMKIDPNSIAHLMSVLTDLYSDPKMAVVREYSTNARDSHVEAGVKRPIEITLPNNMSPYFKVKDYGVGMDTTDIENIYSQYGASTKRGTDTQTGMLGLGCKSALTYTSQFTIVGVKGGVKTTAVVSRVEDGTGVMEIVDTTPSTEPNGVEIAIPVRQGDTFIREAKRFFQFWEPGSVLLNGEEPKFVDGKKVNEQMMVVNYGNLESDIIVMGGVPYPVESLSKGQRAYGSFRVVAWVEIGDVNFTPSREALAMTPLTKTTVEVLKQEFSDALLKKVQGDIDAAIDHPSALAEYLAWDSFLGRSMPDALTYKGEVVPMRFTGDFQLVRPHYTRGIVTQTAYISHDNVRNSVIITDYSGVKITLHHRKKMAQWAEENGHSVREYIVCKDQPGLPWIKNDRVVKWDEIQAIKLPKSGPRAVVEVKYPVVGSGGYAVDTLVDDIDDQSPVYYIGPRDNNKNRNNLAALTKAFPDATIILVGENRWEKLRRQFPKAQHVNSVVRARFEAAEKALTTKDKMNLGMDYSEKNLLSALNPDDVLDPAIADGIRTAKGMSTTATLTEYEKALEIYRLMGYYANSPATKRHLLTDYPLIKGSYNVDKRHAVIYMNAVYTANQNGAI